MVERDIENYLYRHSLFDVWICAFVRCLCIYIFLFTNTHYTEARSSRCFDLAFWSLLLSFVLGICKLIVFGDWANAAVPIILLLSNFILNIIEFFLTYYLRPSGSNDWDIAEVEEREARAKRQAVSKQADERANETRQALLAANDYEGIARLEAAERQRREAEAFVEKEAALAFSRSKHKQSVRLSELFILLRPYFWPAGLGPRLIVIVTWVFLIGSKLCSLFAPIFIGRAADILVSQGRVPYTEIAIYCSLVFGNTALKQCQNAVYLSVKQEAFAQVAEFTFRHLHALSHNWHLKKKMGNVLRSMDRGISSADSVVSYIFLYLLPSLAECVAVFVIFYTHFDLPALSAIVFFFLALYITTTVEITILRKKFRRATNKHDSEFHDKANDSLTNFESVKYFCNEDHETSRYIESVRKFQHFSVSTQLSLSALNSIQTFCIQACLCLSLFVTGWAVVRGDMTIGDFSSVNAYVISIFAPLSFLGSIYDMVVQSFVDMNNLTELLAEEPDVADNPGSIPLKLRNPAGGASVVFKNVSFAYPGQKDGVGIHDLSFTVPAGTTTAVVGTTGAGKSTIGRLLFRFYDVNQGAIEVDGYNVQNVTQRSLRHAIGVVPQDTALFNDTLLYNIRYGNMDASMEKVEEACRKAQILDFILAQKSQWETMVGERGLRLSGGEKQRVAIARALLKDPAIVLLDEATSALDTVKEREIQRSLQTLGKGRTTIVIAHRLSTVKSADQIIVLEAGAVVERGTHDELLALGGKYADLWGQQVASTQATEGGVEVEDVTGEDSAGDDVGVNPAVPAETAGAVAGAISATSAFSKTQAPTSPGIQLQTPSDDNV